MSTRIAFVCEKVDKDLHEAVIASGLFKRVEFYEDASYACSFAADKGVDIFFTDDIDNVEQLLSLGKVVFYEKYPTGDMLLRAIRYGVFAYIVSRSPAEILKWALTQISEGRGFVDGRVSHKVLLRVMHVPFTKYDTLTRRENEVVNLIAHGMTNMQIADALYISEKTVRNHITNILGKLELRDRTQLAIFALNG